MIERFMFGYKDTRIISSAGVVSYLIAVLFGMVIYFLEAFHIIPLNTEALVTIAVALVGWVVGVQILFLQIKLSLRRQLESRAITDIQKAMNVFSKDAAVTVTFSNNFVVVPMGTLPMGFWQNEAIKKHLNIVQETQNIRGSFSALYVALESNEVAIIHLENYYRYLTITITAFIERIDHIGSKFIASSVNTKKKNMRMCARYMIRF